MKASKKTYRIPRVFQIQLSTRNNIFSSEEFKALVRYERMRSDRNGSPFSVAVFSIEGNTGAVPQKAVNDLSGFTRAIDCIGCDENGLISVLLPDTACEGADIFAKKAIEGMKAINRFSFSVEVYSYPDHWLANALETEGSAITGQKATRSFREKVEAFYVTKVPGWKRLMDITVSGAMLLVLSPVLAFTAVFIKIVSPGPVLYKQTRIGYKGLPFTLYKFRSMKHGNNEGFHGKHSQSFIKDGDVPMLKLDGHDPRIIFGGKVLRKSCIDELPQLFNILRGDMSLVGPRPCIPYEAEEYLRWHTHRFDTIPGLSGLWQVSGKNNLTFKQMIRLDITYCQHITPLGDLAIIFRTPIAIVKMILESLEEKRQAKQEAERVSCSGASSGASIAFPEEAGQLVNS